MGESQALDRRVFLARVGLLGAALSVPVVLARVAGAVREPTQLAAGSFPLLDALTQDTLSGVAVFVVPGPDAYSRAQGTPRTEPGAIEARAPAFLADALNNFLPFPDLLGRPLAQALAGDLRRTLPPLDPLGRLPLVDELLRLPQQEVDDLDRLLLGVLQRDEAVPLAPVVALLVNLVAVQVNPLAVVGPFLSPFARLPFADKARVFKLLEGADADLVRVLDGALPEPLRGSGSGLLKFVGGAVLEFAAFGAFCEWAVLDPETRELRARPVGWRLTGYQPDGPVEGWDDFKGYYQDRKEVQG
jgi:hypothetical protein